MRRSATLALGVLALAGCSNVQKHPASCVHDSDCPGPEVCFINGCGDPGQNIVIEITPSVTDQAFPEEFAFPLISGTENVQLVGPATLQGNVSQQDGLGNANPHLNAVSFLASGTSLLLPGVARSSAGYTQGTGTYTFNLSGGDYTVVAYPADLGLPPLAQSPVLLASGQQLGLDYTFPATSSLVTLNGALSQTAGVPVSFDMTVQALDPNQQPLSQKILIPAGGSGAFTLMLAPQAATLPRFALVFAPASAQAPVPQKVFSLNAQQLDAGSYQLGDYGSTLAISGQVVDSAGQPVASAQVHVQGPVQGGGIYQSASVLTAGDGTFSLTTLPSAPDAGFHLVALPPPLVPAGLLSTTVSVQPGQSFLGVLPCPERTLVQGTVVMPDGVTPAPGVSVRAVPLLPAVLDGGSIPPVGGSASTDATGAFSIYLDPAGYRFDFQPGGSLPLVSTFQVVDGTHNPLTLPQEVLSKGRLVEGLISVGNGGSPSLAGHALVKFYRVTPDGGATGTAADLGPIPLGATYSDSSGNYSVEIPTR